MIAYGKNWEENMQGSRKQNRINIILTISPPLVLKAGRYFATLIFMGLAVHLILPELASFEASFQVIREMVLWAVLLAAIAQIISYLGAGYLIHSLVEMVNQSISVLKGTIITLAAASIGMLAGDPFGNGAATYRWVRKYGISAEGSGLAGILPTIFNNAILTLLAIAGMLHLILAHELSSIQFFIFFLILIFLCLGLLAISWGKGHKADFISTIDRIAAYFARTRHKSYNPASIETSVDQIFSAFDIIGKGGWKRPIFGAIVTAGFDMLTLYFFFIAAGYEVEPEILIVGYGLPIVGYGLPLLLGKMAFLLPGGVGVVESTMAALYTGLGVPGPIAVVVILSYRIFSFWIPTSIGFPIAFYLQRT